MLVQEPILMSDPVPACCPAGETYRVGDVVNHNGRLSASVVHWSQAVVALLTRCVPDLELHCGVIQTDGLSEEGSCRRQQIDRTIMRESVYTLCNSLLVPLQT